MSAVRYGENTSPSSAHTLLCHWNSLLQGRCPTKKFLSGVDRAAIRVRKHSQFGMSPHRPSLQSGCHRVTVLPLAGRYSAVDPGPTALGTFHNATYTGALFISPPLWSQVLLGGISKFKRRLIALENSSIENKICWPRAHLWRHRRCLGCFCTHHSLGGRIRPPVPSRKRMDVERRTRRHSKDLDETLPNHFRKFKIEVTCQVKVRSKVKIGCIQVADRSDLKRGIFRPKTFICTPNDQAKVLTSEIVSYLAQVKVKVRSEKVTKPKIFKWVVWHMF